MKKHVKCLWCFSLRTQRWGKRKIRKRIIQKFKCLNCNHIFSKRITKGVLTKGEKINITLNHLEDRTSIRQLVRNTGLAKQTVQNAIHETVENCVDSAWIAKTLNPKWGGYLAVDGSYIRVYDWSAKYFPYSKNQRRFLHKLVWLVALDLETLDIVHHYLAEEETMIDLILFYRQIKDNGYKLNGLVSDGNPDIPRAARMVFKNNFKHQLCIRHFLENLRVKLQSNNITQKQYERFCKAVHTGKDTYGLPKELFAYQNCSQLPRTNQQIENLFRQSRLRTRSIGQFHSYQTAFNYLNAWTLFRRFTPFTDNRNKERNHQAPLQLAKCDITNMNYLKPKTNIILGR